MKRSLSILLSFLILIALLPACRQKPKYHIAVSQCSYDDWRLKLNDEMETQSLLYPDVELEIKSAYDDPERQRADIRAFIAEGVDVIITSPLDSENLNDVLDEARQAGIKVIVFDRQPSRPVYDMFVAADNPMLGQAAAEYLIDSRGGDAHILEIWGTTTSSPARGRHEGFVRALAANPSAACVASLEGDWNEARAEALVDSILPLHPDIDAIFAHNDRMAIGARKSTLKASRPDIVIAGIDAVPSLGMKAVADGTIDATFIYPTAGKELIDLGVKAARGEPLENELIISTAQPVVRQNADMLLEINRSIADEKDKVDYLHSQVDLYTARHTEQRALLFAIIAIVILLAIVIFTLLRAYWTRRRSQEVLAAQNAQLMQQRDALADLNQRLNEATQAKLVFFTNVSHDLRTPLTLIAEPVGRLAHASNLTPDQQLLIRLADKNVRILRRLINQILDFRKYENGKLNLRPVEMDIRLCFEEWAESFAHLAHKRHIRFSLEFGELSRPTAALDQEKLERVFFNLMSNAFKFTPDNGVIRAHVSLSGGSFILKVSDSGRGMDSETLSHVFERFYQADKVEPRGSGIGLALVKAFANLHGGDVSVESAPGAGSTFTVTIPESHIETPAPRSGDPVPQSDPLSAPVAELSPIENPDPGEIDESKPCILVVDDTPDIRLLVRTLLKDDYTILEADGGKQGIRLASKYIPDLIICDVMMPDLGGMEVCRRLKEETSTSHIPILMLTACSLDEQRAEGYDSGADGYLSKPFDADVLRARCRALIANRRRLLAAQTDLIPSKKAESADTPRQSATPSDNNNNTETASARVKKAAPNAAMAVENDFYRRFIAIVEQEIGNPDITVEEIGARLGLSRVQFYRKIKALTNYSPNEILRIHRLKKAHTLLTSTDSTVSEIAYSVGFSSPGYFSKCFKEYYSELPADLQKRTSRLQ